MYEKEKKCSDCRRGSSDTLEDLGVTCQGRGDMILLHDWLRDNILSDCSCANLSPVYEQKNLMPETNSRPGDVYLHCCCSGQPVDVDLTTTSQLERSNISNVASMSGFAPRTAEDRRFEQFSQKSASIGVFSSP